ncbi:WXG100 family type VII secretion target [Nocardia uniformis]|uniref:WXG100 family type VII secretion target n=1 Tax=Nocardia uniformis TaxID=53432 RepID=A0A849BZ95_9NOCA|nr:WXG100 family type VII secretion target [Nocardia uniformis]NNH71873.1 WXG100 family type VII secretion target [Nocardia uniformis]
MSGEINFQGAEANAAKEEMADAVIAVRITINEVTEAAGAVKRGWQGDANLAFDAVASSWEDEAQRLQGILNQMTETVGDGNTKYQAMEADNEDFFKNAAGTHDRASSPHLTNL